MDMTPKEPPEAQRYVFSDDEEFDGLTDSEVGPAWEAEIGQRLNDLESGQAETLDADEALRRIDHQLRQR